MIGSLFSGITMLLPTGWSVYLYSMGLRMHRVSINVMRNNIKVAATVSSFFASQHLYEYNITILSEKNIDFGGKYASTFVRAYMFLYAYRTTWFGFIFSSGASHEEVLGAIEIVIQINWFSIRPSSPLFSSRLAYHSLSLIHI